MLYIKINGKKQFKKFIENLFVHTEKKHFSLLYSINVIDLLLQKVNFSKEKRKK